MKKISSFIFAASALIITASCAKEINVVDPTPDNGKEIDITVIASEKPAVDAATKTYIDGTSVKWSETGEKLKVFEVATPSEGDVVTTQATSAEGVTTDSGATMSFGVTLADKSEGYSSFDYYAVYPSSAYQSHNSVNAVALNTKGSQTPTATNFDASQDLLIAKKIEGEISQAKTLEMQFARVVAIGKMTIKNLETTDPITKITFSAKVGEEAVALAGRTNFNLETAKPVNAYASNTQDHAIILDYEGQNITADTSTGMVAYFTCYPFVINAEAPGSFKVVVETATQSFTKEVSVSSAKGLAFNIGKGSVFSVDMDGIAGKTKAVDLRYAYLDSDDYVNAGGSNTYSNITVSKTHGDAWETHARYDAGIQINSGYYIKLPDFAEDIKTVIVTLPVAASGKTLSLNTLANGSGTEIASLTTDSELSYEFDLSSDSYKTAYLLSDGTIKFSKIEVYAGTDNRAVLDAPQNVAASLNNDDAEVTNSIDVSWDAIDGAGSYIITLMDENTDITTKVADASPFTVTGLAYDMEYLIAVKAVPADPYVNKESAETDAADAVTTGSEPVAAAYELVTSLANVTSGQYVIAAHVGDKYYAMSNTFATKISGTEIAVVNNKISTSAAVGYEVTITRVNNTVSIFNGSKYLAIATTGTYFTIQDEAYYNTIATGSNGGTFHISNTRGLIYRASTYNVFGNYASVNGTEYFDIELFRLADPRTDVTLAFAEDAFEFTVGSSEYDNFAPQTVTATPSVSPITYAIEDNDGVTSSFNTSTGAFTLTGELGTATITASYAGDASYKPAEVSYTVTVKGLPNDGTLEHPYTASEAKELALGGDNGSYYISGIVTRVQNQYSASYGTANFWIDENGSAADVFEGYKIKYFGNVDWVDGNAEIAVNDEVIIYGTLTIYNSTVAETSSGYLVSLNGKTKGLTPGSLTTTTDDENKQITVTWGAATGTETAISYVVNCGTQSYNANAAGSHTFTMADYGTFDVSVVASADDAAPATAKESVLLTDPDASSTTVSMTSFTATSGYVDDDTNVSYEAAKGTASTAPAVNSSQIRIYQNGGLLTITANNSKTITNITIGSAMATNVQVSIDNGSYSADNAITAGGTYSTGTIRASTVTFKCTGTDKNSRLYLNSLSVTYE